jgi:hypothetical protein
MGKVPLPGARAEVAGLALLAEGGKDARGRVRITSVLVERLDRTDTADAGAGDDPSDERDEHADASAGRREESDVRHG